MPKTTRATESKAGAQPKGRWMACIVPLQPTENFVAVVGDKPLARSEVVSKLSDHIQKNDLKNSKDNREMLADDKLEKVFGREEVTMFEMNKVNSPHLQ